MSIIGKLRTLVAIIHQLPQCFEVMIVLFTVMNTQEIKDKKHVQTGAIPGSRSCHNMVSQCGCVGPII
jgi:hypothetical protein